MANTKSAIKRIRRIAKQTQVNKARKSKYRNVIKKMNLLLQEKKKADAVSKNRCTAIKKSGGRCKNLTKNKNKRCYAHQ